MKVPPLPRTPSGLFSAYTQGLSSTELERIFTRDTADAYKFFSRHLDFDALKRLPWHRRAFTQARLVFLAFTMKLSPGRRALNHGPGGVGVSLRFPVVHAAILGGFPNVTNAA